MPFYSVFLGLTSQHLGNPGWTAPTRANQFLRKTNNCPASVPFEYKPTNPEPTSQPPPLSGSNPNPNPSICPNHPRARYQTTGDGCYAPEPAEKFPTSQY